MKADFRVKTFLLKSLDNVGHPNWFTHVRKLLGKYDLLFLSEHDCLSMDVYKEIKKSVLIHFQRKFLSSISDSKANPKLRTYKMFKREFTFESYLAINISKYRTSLCRMRTGSHYLEIERGRYAVPKIPAEARLCVQCNLNAVEDEIHFVLHCPKYTVFSRDLFFIARMCIARFTNMTDDEKFVALFTSQVGEVTLAKF